MKKRLLMTLCGVLSGFALAFADDVNYSGTVVSKSGEPIMGATVTVTGTTVSTITDMDGKFSLVVPDGYSTVTVTYSGMKKQTVSVQREPVVLYASAEQAEQARMALAKPVKPKRSYKKNAFNLEIGYGEAIGDWNDFMCDFYDSGTSSFNYLSLNLGWHHNFSKYIGWEVFNIGAFIPESIDSYHDMGNYYLTTGVKLCTPSWKGLSLFYSFNIGTDYDSYIDHFELIIRHKLGINFGKWVYLAANYNVVNLSDTSKDYYCNDLQYSQGYDAFTSDIPKNIDVVTLALGFNF